MFFKADVLKNFTKITVKQLHWSLFLIKLQAYSKIFTGDCFSDLLELSMVFDPVKKSIENVKLNVNTKSLIFLKIKIIS